MAQGVSATLRDRGSVHKFLPYLVLGVQHGLQDIGVRNIRELQYVTLINTPCTFIYPISAHVTSGSVKFERRSNNAQLEGGVHSLES